jgi:hypothetical protein
MHEEKREYIRIRDKAVVLFKNISSVPDEGAPFPLPLPVHFKLLNEIVSSEGDTANLLHAVESDSSATAKYFKLVNGKIDALAKLIVESHPDAKNYKEQTISISETGVDFYHIKQLNQDDILALNLVFMPHYLSFEIYARVVSALELKDDSIDIGSIYRYGLEFIRTSDNDRDRIARRIFHKQLEERRRQRQS